MKKMNFIIATHQYDYGSGGNNVLHKLAKLLFQKGHNVYTFGKGNFGYQYKLLDIKNYDNESRNWEDFNKHTKILTNLQKNNTFIIVPESFPEDKIDILEEYGKILIWVLIYNNENRYEFYNNNNRLYFYYHKGYNKYNYQQDGILSVIDTDYNFWMKRENKTNNTNSVCLRKARYYNLNKEFFDINIHKLNEISQKPILNFDDICPHFYFDPYSQIKRQAKNNFNQSEIFLCFDNHTFFPVQAAMSGCISIIVPNYNFNYTPKKFREMYPIASKGIAYGFEDLDHMFDTQHEILPLMKEIEQNSKDDVNNMIDICIDSL